MGYGHLGVGVVFCGVLMSVDDMPPGLAVMIAAVGVYCLERMRQNA